MLRHTDQWRFGVFWQDASDGSSDGTGGQGGTAQGFGDTGVTSSGSQGTVSVSRGDGSPTGETGVGMGGGVTANATDQGVTASFGAPAGTGYGSPSATVGPPGTTTTAQGFGQTGMGFGSNQGGGGGGGGGGGAPSSGGGGGGGGGAASGVAGAAGTGAATGGGGGTAAGGSASGPGGVAALFNGFGGGGGTSIGDIASNFFSSIMGSPANAKSLYGDPGSAAAYMSPAQIQAINKGLAQGQPSTPAFGNLGVQSIMDILSGNALGSGLGNVAQGTPSPALGSLALAIALGDTFGAIGGHAPSGDSPAYGFTTTMGYPAQNPTIGIRGDPQGTPAPVGSPFGGAVAPAAPSVRGPGTDANAPVSTYGDLGGGPAGQNTTGMPTGVGGADVAGGMPTGLDFGDNVGPPAPPSDVIGPPSLQDVSPPANPSPTDLATVMAQVLGDNQNPTEDEVNNAYNVAKALIYAYQKYGPPKGEAFQYSPKNPTNPPAVPIPNANPPSVYNPGPNSMGI